MENSKNWLADWTMEQLEWQLAWYNNRLDRAQDFVESDRILAEIKARKARAEHLA